MVIIYQKKKRNEEIKIAALHVCVKREWSEEFLIRKM